MKILLSCLLILISNYSHAQLGGTFMDKDSTYIRLFKSLNVHTVNEFTKVNGETWLSGRSVYDGSGRLTEFYWNNYRSVVKFDSLGRQCGEQYYEKDSEQVSRFYLHKLDEHGHIIQSITGELKNEKLDTTIQVWRVLRKNNNVCARRLDYEIQENGLRPYYIEIDSVDGIYKTYTTIEYPVNKRLSEEKTKYIKKEMNRTYKIHDTTYNDEIHSLSFDSKEIFNYCVTYYSKDKNDSIIRDAGTLDYSSVLATYGIKGNNRQNDTTTLPAAFIKSLLNGELRGKVKFDRHELSLEKVDKRGLKLESSSRSYQHYSESKYTYNSKNQLREILTNGWGDENNIRSVYVYNEAGLPVNLVIYPNVKGSTTPYMEINYSYTFYDK